MKDSSKNRIDHEGMETNLVESVQEEMGWLLLVIDWGEVLSSRCNSIQKRTGAASEERSWLMITTTIYRVPHLRRLKKADIHPVCTLLQHLPSVPLVRAAEVAGRLSSSETEGGTETRVILTMVVMPGVSWHCTGLTTYLFLQCRWTSTQLHWRKRWTATDIRHGRQAFLPLL